MSGGAANTIEPSQPNTDGVVIDVTSGGPPAFPGAPNDTSPAIQAGINTGIPGSIVDNAVQPNLASTVPDEVVQAVFADVVSGIISTPAGMTNLSSGVVAAEDPIHAPEPATLILFASGLIVAAHRLRRRR